MRTHPQIAHPHAATHTLSHLLHMLYTMVCVCLAHSWQRDPVYKYLPRNFTRSHLNTFTRIHTHTHTHNAQHQHAQGGIEDVGKICPLCWVIICICGTTHTHLTVNLLSCNTRAKTHRVTIQHGSSFTFCAREGIPARLIPSLAWAIDSRALRLRCTQPHNQPHNQPPPLKKQIYIMRKYLEINALDSH
jgi:hypothetical protein